MPVMKSKFREICLLMMSFAGYCQVNKFGNYKVGMSPVFRRQE